VGEYVPGGGSRYLLATGNARRVGARTVLTGTARFFAAGAGPAENPLLRDVPSADSAGRQRMRQYTLGGSLRLTPDAVWTHTMVAGLDGGRVAGPLDAFAPTAYDTDAGRRWSEGGADRLTLRWSSVARLFDGARTDFAATFAAEHSTLREQVAAHPGLGIYGAATLTPAGANPEVLWTQSTGIVAQANTTLDDRLHLTAGVRLERNDGLADVARHAWLPVLGAAWLTPLGDDATLKLRAAFGRGIRPVRTPGRVQAWGSTGLPIRGLGLAPEEQEGVEGGFDLAVGRVLQLQVTVFDQLASGLIQRVARPVERDDGTRGTAYLLQNLGEISNRGWEVQGSALLGGFSVEGAFSRVDSRVRQVAVGYTGDLRRGDRMLEVPRSTLTLTGAYAGDGWSASLTGYRAFDWINYDRVALARDQAAAWGPQAMAGDGLRGYWLRYPGVTHVNGAATLDVRGGWVLVLSGENLLDHQRGEPDNATVVPGRTVSLGLRAAF
jgi:iron complex outermembrane receptor protein